MDSSISPLKDKKIPNLEMFQGKSLEQIKKMKVGPDGKPLSLYKIKKYILPHHKILSEIQKTREEPDHAVKAEDQSSHDSNENLQAGQQNRGRKRKSNLPVNELDKQTSMNSIQVKQEDGRYMDGPDGNEGELRVPNAKGNPQDGNQ